MIAKGNHYSSRLAAQKARAAFRLTAKTGGNSMGILWYNDCQRQSLQFPPCRPKGKGGISTDGENRRKLNGYSVV